jgi:DNA-binding MarR family transcriptional regulator
MLEINDNELASRLRVSISRLVKVIRSEVKIHELLSLTENSTLSTVYKQGEMLPSEIAAKEKVTSQSMSQIINKLNELGFILKTPSLEDKRKVIITITPKGKEFIDVRMNQKMEWLEKAITDKTTDAEKEVLKSAIAILTKLVE